MSRKNVILLSFPNAASSSLKACINQYSDHRCKKIKLKNTNFINFFRNLLFKILIKMTIITSKLNFNLSLDFIIQLTNLLSNNEYKFMGFYTTDIVLNYNVKNYSKRSKYLQNIIAKKKIDIEKVNKNLILKNHFAPTKFNTKFFKNYKKILLHRNSMDKYKNYSATSVNENFHKYFIKKIQEESIKWREKWLMEPNILSVDFDMFIKEPRKTLKKIENFADIKFSLPNDFELPKINSSNNTKNIRF